MDNGKVVSTCAWNKTWSPSVLDPCVAASCQVKNLTINGHKTVFIYNPWIQVIPFPPPDSGLVFQPDPDNPITLQSEYNVYNPKLPLTMGFPGDFCGDNGNLMMIVGSVPKVPINNVMQVLSLPCFHCFFFRKVENLLK